MKRKIGVVLLAVFFVVLFRAGEGRAVVPECGLAVSFDIPLAKVMGTIKWPVRAGWKTTLETGTLTVSRVEVNGQPAVFSLAGGRLGFTPAADGQAEIRYEGVFPGDKSAGHGRNSNLSDTIDNRGISLTGLWYPRPTGLVVYHLQATLPRGYVAVSEAEQVTRTETAAGVEFSFAFPHPLDSLSLVASDRFEETEDRAGAIELAAYFFKEDRELAKTYLGQAKSYFARYEKLLAPYPYKRFAIVENFLPTGYSLPTYTLLGRDVVRLPFIAGTSLGHEILHQWFGNGVYVDYGTGNWAEGLTTYLADHLREEERGKGWEYRKQLLINYGAYVRGAGEFSLREFRSRTDESSQAIGYGKAALVFHMLRRKVGDAAFFAALRVFLGAQLYRRASWEDLRQAFESHTGRDLAAFFQQWLEGKGLPEVRLEEVRIGRTGGKFEVICNILRSGGPLLDLPLVLSSRRGVLHREVITLAAEKQTVRLLTDEEPTLLTVDGDYDCARKLTAAELPPVLARLLGEEKTIILLPENNLEPYAALLEGFRKRGAEVREAGPLKDGEIRSASLIVLGRENPVARRLFGSLDPAETGFDLLVKKNPWNGEKVVGIIQSRSAAEAEAAFGKLFHYGKFSSLSFAGGVNVAQGIAPADRGIVREFRAEPLAADPSGLQTLDRIVEAVSAKQVLYVGEDHERFSHHDVQLRIIKALHRKHGRLAIGMEMFQRPFQKVLDGYIDGTMEEREFLAKSEYFKRWVFDYNLYKPILDYARAEKIPVVTLNLSREITEKVSRQGMDSLTAAERQELPEEMDFSDTAYRERLREVFRQHKSAGERNFDFFFQAQITWDETMAQSIANYLKRNPAVPMVVLAGAGHLAYGAGIPKRVFRRNGLPYAVILNDSDLERDIADYVVFPQPLEGLTAPRLLAQFKEEQGRLTIEGFAKESVAEQAGLMAGDVVIALDGARVHGLEDIRLALFYKNKGAILKVSVLRQEATSGEQTMEFEVQL